MKELNFPFIKCFNPIRITNRVTLDTLYTSCGHCKACLYNKANKHSFLCKLEEQDNKYCMFVTLTYAPEYLPMVKLHYQYDTNIGMIDRPLEDVAYVNFRQVPRNGVDNDKELAYYKGLKRLAFNDNLVSGGVFSYDDTICIFPKQKDYDIDKFLRKVNLCGFMPYLSKYDLQLFIKRVREKVRTETYEKIRHYSIGEYGPKTFRPHYHILFYFNEKKTLEAIEQIIRSSWTYGRVDVSLSRGKCNSYVAKYVNCNSVIPRLLANSAFRPFSVHSSHFAEGFYKDKKQEIYSHEFRRFIEQSRNLDGKVIEFLPWRSLASRYFPKCREYSLQSSHELYKSYTRLSAAIRIYKETKISTLANLISFDAIVLNKVNDLAREYRDLYYKRKLCPEQLHDIIERDLYCSSYFQRFVCDNNPNKYIVRVHDIISFWKAYDQYLLEHQLQSQEQLLDVDVSTGASLTDLEYYYWYDNADEYFEEHPQANNTIKSTLFYKEWYSRTLNNFENSGKHKELNDLNRIFL